MLKRIKNQSVGDTIFDIVVALFLLLAVVVCVYPFLYVISVSISSGEAVNKGLVTLLPVDLNFEALKSVLNYDQLWVSYGNTIFYTVAGTFFNIIFTCLAAYPLSRKTFCFRKQMNFLLALLFRRIDSDLYRCYESGIIQQQMGNDFTGVSQCVQCYDLPFRF